MSQYPIGSKGKVDQVPGHSSGSPSRANWLTLFDRLAQDATIALRHCGLGRSNWTTITALSLVSFGLTRNCGGPPIEHACLLTDLTAGHSILRTVFPLTIMATGMLLGTSRINGPMAVSARPAGDGMLRMVMPPKW